MLPNLPIHARPITTTSKIPRALSPPNPNPPPQQSFKLPSTAKSTKPSTKLAPIKQTTILPKPANTDDKEQRRSRSDSHRKLIQTNRRRKTHAAEDEMPDCSSCIGFQRTELQSPKFPAHHSHAGGARGRRCRRSWLRAKTFVGVGIGLIRFLREFVGKEGWVIIVETRERGGGE